MTALVSELRLWLRQARLPDAHGLGELGDQKLILVRRAHPAGVADAKAFTSSEERPICVSSSLIDVTESTSP